MNTVSNPHPGFRDETPRIRCSKCGNLLLLGRGMHYEEDIAEISLKHIELCEGDAAETLVAVEQLLKRRTAS